MALIDRQIRPSKHMFSNPPSFVVNGTQTKAEIQIDEPKEGLVGQSLGWATSFPNCNQNLRSTTNRRDSTPQMIISIIELCATFVLRTSLLFCTCFPPSLLVPISQASSYLIFILIHCVKLTSIQDRSKKKKPFRTVGGFIETDRRVACQIRCLLMTCYSRSFLIRISSLNSRRPKSIRELIPAHGKHTEQS